MKALKRYVERVVRPIRASERRKDRMREELLAHLSRLYAEELPGATDEVAAVAAAMRRFGAAAELSRDLQASVPRVERWAFFPLPGISRLDRRADESARAHLLRLIKLTALVEVPLLTLIIVGGICTVPSRFVWMSTMATVAPVLAPFVLQIGLFGWVFLCESTRERLHAATPQGAPASRRHAIPLIVCAVLSIAVFSGSASVMLSLAGHFHSGFTASAWILGSLLGAVLTALTVRQSSTTERRFKEWGSLDLDGEPAA